MSCENYVSFIQRVPLENCKSILHCCIFIRVKCNMVSNLTKVCM